MEEKEIAPGIYVTDYRRNSGYASRDTTSAYIDDMKSLSAEEFVQELVARGENTPPILEQHKERLELSLAKLKESNEILATYQDDPDCLDAFQENLKVIEHQQKMLDGIIKLLGESEGVYL